ncbi:activator of (R)-2-hydroxyglutaryl-CoA dehydratase [Nannocystis pusilla]|uniref:activator of (R)-2-hydroxyglutaryl-CoA dehydratase n=1 Tax=Nannocystis pusilla TaxID=889268 RepID=UPI003DA4D9D3
MATTTTTPTSQRTSLKILSQPQVKSLLDEAQQKFAQEEGVSFGGVNMHFKKPFEHSFTAPQRPHTTLLFGGLTFRHEHLLKGVFESLGYKTAVVPTPNVDAFQLGKEYGNNGQCNPTYFTVGNLVQYLQHLRDKQGMSVQEIIDSHVFLTAGACGPCRFGMYEAEYRLALRNAGFDGFRVMLFQQKGGLKQGDLEAGLKMNLDFFAGMVSAFNCGDILSEVANCIRAYETVPGATDKAASESLEFMYRVMKRKQPAELAGTTVGDLLKGKNSKAFDIAEQAVKFLDLLTSEDYIEPLRHVARKFDEVEVDRLQPKPIVKVTGEFWAQTTEGDGNFNMFRFLHSEGAEVITEPIATWLAYMLWQTKIKARDRHGLVEKADEVKWYELGKRAQLEMGYMKKRAIAKVADTIFRREYSRMVEALGHIAHEIVDMDEMERLGHGFYHTRSEGGEGHLEVSKNIYYSHKGLAHMVLSLKPFGCMPSTQSDGAQSAVVNRYKEMIFLPIETSGEGEINAHSRVQMALGEAKAKAKREFAEVLSGIPYSLEELKAYVDAHPEMKRPMYQFPRQNPRVVGTGANFALHVAERMQADGVKPKQVRVAAE